MEKLLKDGLICLEIEPTDELIQDFLKYMEMMLDYNKNVNLTTITEPTDVITKHFLDSVSQHKEVSGNVIDVGTGAGFPGLPLKMVNPSLDMTLLDSLNKRIIFLENVITELKLSKTQCVHSRAEDFSRTENRETYDTVVSRAVANLSSLAEYCLPLAKIGGKFISMKSVSAKDEISQAKKAISVLGGEISDVKTIKIPFTDIEHSLIIIRKIQHTDAKYPRKAIKIAKNPIL